MGLDPSQGSGLVEIIDDPDKNAVFKIHDNDQKLVIKATDGVDTVTTEYSLKKLVLETE